MDRLSKWLNLPIALQQAIIASARDATPVSGLTHSFYKYPARFSPNFARTVIEAFTSPGDLVLDNHVGGGTTLVECLALGRHAIGVDISTLAEFVARVKTTVFSEGELNRLESWTIRAPAAIDIHKPSECFGDYYALGYYKHLNNRSRWRLRKAIDQAIRSAIRLRNRRLEAFGRCAVLRTSQWALDGRSKLPTIAEFRDFLQQIAVEMVDGARELRATVNANSHRSRIEIIARSAAGIEEDVRLSTRGPPKLVITSPPYPGVHVLYHRWQVDGRKEAPLPFMIANKLDGAFESFYTMGDRKYPGLRTYFENIRSTMSSVATLADAHTVIVQMVGFSEPKWQLPLYLRTMEEVGLQERFLPSLRGMGDGRLWRSVPGRRWYSDQRGDTSSSREVVLLHVKQRSGSQGIDRVGWSKKFHLR
jgi:hypothetical protein